jgi:hypothetical protein
MTLTQTHTRNTLTQQAEGDNHGASRMAFRFMDNDRLRLPSG